MKLTAIILFTACLQVSAKTYSQQVTLTLKHASLEKALNEIQKQTGYNVVYAKIELDNAHPVDVDVHNADLQQVLFLCFKDQPLTYTIEDKYIVVKRKPAETKQLIEQTIATPPSSIRGRIVDADGQAVSGATVTLKGSKVIGITNDGGVFSVNVSIGDVLVISSVGFEPAEYKITAAGIESQVPFSITLKRSTSKLDEVQVIAYGTQTKRFSTGNVSSMQAEDIAKQPVNNPLLAMEGQMPGVFISQSTGFAGGGIKVQVQSKNSLLAGNDPFYVIDGVPYSPVPFPSLSGVFGGNNSASLLSGATTNGVNPLSFINPDDIESISVLKDASATAIYGSRAANGAILITTKKGKAGKAKVSLNLQDGFGRVAEKLNLMNVQQYLYMRHTALALDGFTPGPGDYDLNGTWDTTHTTDWQKTLLGNSAHYQNYNGSVSGGNNNIQYLIGSTYHRETTVFPLPSNYADTKASVHFSVGGASDNQKFRFQLTGSYLSDHNQLPQTDLTSYAMTAAPVAPAMYNPDGTPNYQPNASGASTFTGNPAFKFLQTYHNQATNLNSNAMLSYELLPGLMIKSSLGYTSQGQNESQLNPLVSYRPDVRATSTRGAQFGNYSSKSWIIEPQLNYKLTIGKGRLETLLGTTIQQSSSGGYQLAASGFTSDQLLNNLQSASAIFVGSSTASEYKYNAVFGRINYNWLDKYLLDFSIRRDGSSRFGDANKFHDFAAVGAGWIFSEEHWLKSRLPFLSYGKLKASYGSMGNDQIGDYSYLNLYPSLSAQVAYQGVPALRPGGLPNPFLQWEVTHKLNTGLDFGFLNDRLLFSVNYYRYRSSNELLSYNLPSITGFGGLTANLPATIQSTGWEFTATTTNTKTKNFSWITAINLSLPGDVQKLVSFPGLAQSSYASTSEIGQPFGEGHGNGLLFYHYMGVDPATGLYLFSDGKGGTTSKPEALTTSKVPIATTGNVRVRYGGITNTFRYKNFTLSFLFQLVRQKGVNFALGNTLSTIGLGAFNVGQGNQLASMINAWTGPGSNAVYQRFTTGFNYFSNTYLDAVSSDLTTFRDASYIRLKNVSLSWQLPVIWSKHAGMQGARLYVQGQNLLTFTHYIGLDPENLSSLSLPPLRVITFGIQADF